MPKQPSMTVRTSMLIEVVNEENYRETNLLRVEVKHEGSTTCVEVSKNLLTNLHDAVRFQAFRQMDEAIAKFKKQAGDEEELIQIPVKPITLPTPDAFIESV